MSSHPDPAIRTPDPAVPSLYPQAPSDPGRLPMTLPLLIEKKRLGDPIVMVTAYDYPSARAAEAAGVDLVLVGDSAATTVLGYNATTPVELDDMLVLARAVRRGLRTPLLIGDLPFGSYEVSDEQAITTAVRMVKVAGCEVVKLEGGGEASVSRVRAIVGAGIPSRTTISSVTNAGAIALLALALSALGIDLQNIALIAGALSVGIGFGLQSVVSNFVCGLILLAERPIRVGDWVVVKNEEGWVRRISVRATEIETFDRASVIIPNQEFITGVVKNWTHGNTMGRIVIKVRVAFDSDLDKVRDVLMGCGAGHPQVLRTPPPAVYLMGFGDIGIDFELRCLIGNVEQAHVFNEIVVDFLSRIPT